jgi:hypothetical protein
MKMFSKTPSSIGLVFAGLIIFLVKLWLIGPHDLVAINAPHDDLLFATQAENIVEGSWLGPYNQLTLIKGPFYPIFIAGAHFLGIPLLSAQQILYAIACGVVIWALSPAIRQHWILLLIFVFLLLNPFSYNYPAMGRILRLGIYQSLGMLTIGSMIGLYLRIGDSWIKTVGWAVLTGVSISALWHTREESIWIVPTLVLMTLALALRIKTSGYGSFKHLITALLISAMIWLGLTATLKGLNSHFYGVSVTIEMKTAEFKSAYGGLLRIRTDSSRRFYPVVSEAREQAYKVSPAFAELKPFLDGEQGKHWIDLAHSDDFPAGFFIWAFRDAVAAAGYYQDSTQALELYRQIGLEIDAACNAGKLNCRPRYTSLMPPWSREYNKLLLPTFASIFKRIVYFQGFSADIEDIMSKGNAEMMQRIELITREKLRTSRMDKLKGYPDYHNHLNIEKVRILNDVGACYQLLIPPLFYGSLALMLLLGLVPKTRRISSRYLVFYLSLLAGLCSIVFILSLVVITSYASIHRAMHVSYPLVLLMIVCTLLAVIEVIYHRRQEPLR